MRALTAARLLLHPDRYPWFTSLCFRTFRLHPLYNAPVAAMLCYRPRLGPRFALAAIGGASDFVQSQQSQQSYSAVSSSDRESPLDSSVYGLSLHFQLLSTSPRGDAVTFSYWRLAPPERDFHPLALAAPKRTGSDLRSDGSRSLRLRGLGNGETPGQRPGQPSDRRSDPRLDLNSYGSRLLVLPGTRVRTGGR